MKIWFFDSWLGGLDTLLEFQSLLPEYDYIYLADNKNNPYWEKSGETIKNLTYQWINFLFSAWANIVILACNTAASASIKSWQKDFPEKKVLSVSIPIVEELVEKKYENILVICTQATKNSKVFETKYIQLWWKNNIEVLATPSLVPLIEKNNIEKLETEIKNILSKKNSNYLVLWCTHYPIVEDIFKKHFSNTLNPAKIAAKKFVDYLNFHPEIENKLAKNKHLEIFYTWKNNFDILGFKWKKSFEVKKIIL